MPPAWAAACLKRAASTEAEGRVKLIAQPSRGIGARTPNRLSPGTSSASPTIGTSSPRSAAWNAGEAETSS
jgi:hypothetical protein